MFNVRWFKPSIDSEYDEILRVAEEERLPKVDIIAALSYGELIELDKALWEKLENTESVNRLTLPAAIQIGESYGRDVRRIVDAFIGPDGELPAPMILQIGRRITVVAGNTRLCVARALNITPKVLIGSL